MENVNKVIDETNFNYLKEDLRALRLIVEFLEELTPVAASSLGRLAEWVEDVVEAEDKDSKL